MPEAIPIEVRCMISRFGAAATVAGMLTPVIADGWGAMAARHARGSALFVECNRLLIVYAAIEASHETAADDDGIPS
jgi:hypothetical protein